MKLEMLRVLRLIGDGVDDAAARLPKLTGGGTGTFLSNMLSWTFGLLGILAVVMIIVSGFQMTTSAGDAGAVTKARNMMIYSIVGLVLAILAYTIVQFVLKEVGQ